jgi:hypothetical protein
MKFRTITSIWIALIIALWMIGYRMNPPRLTEVAAASRLKQAERFNLGGAGISVSITDAENDFFSVLASHRNKELLCEVFETGTPAAKAYALAGLRHLAPKQFEKYGERFIAENTTVSGISGCIGWQMTSAEAVTNLRSRDMLRQYLPLKLERDEHRKQAKND